MKKDFRVGYLYSLSPIHCGGEGNLGNILDISREIHTNFPYIPGSSLRGSLRDDTHQYHGKEIADRLFGQELDGDQMGVHQVWFGDARLLWVPMRTMSRGSEDVFQWVSCTALLRDHAMVSQQSIPELPNIATGDVAGEYLVADAKVEVQALSSAQKEALSLVGPWAKSLEHSTKVWQGNRLILPDSDFQVLLEHALWTQIRNRIQDSGGAEIFWTDICIPRDTIFYYAWGYAPRPDQSELSADHLKLLEILEGLIQVGGQANVGRGWVQSWVGTKTPPEPIKTPNKSVLEKKEQPV